MRLFFLVESISRYIRANVEEAFFFCIYPTQIVTERVT